MAITKKLDTLGISQATSDELRPSKQGPFDETINFITSVVNAVWFWYLTSAPHTHGHFYCGNQAQDFSPPNPGGSKNALNPVAIPLKKGTSGES